MPRLLRDLLDGDLHAVLLEHARLHCERERREAGPAADADVTLSCESAAAAASASAAAKRMRVIVPPKVLCKDVTKWTPQHRAWCAHRAAAASPRAAGSPRRRCAC